MTEISGKAAVVTGGGRMRSIGRPIAVALARAGCDVVVTGTGRAPDRYPEDERAAGWRDIESVADEIRALGRRALPVVSDVSDAAAVESLVERVRTLAAALHALDSDASPDALVKLQLRITEAEAMPADAPERARRLELLQRQQRTLTDLAERRGTLQEQLDHALIVLETMKLDLARLRNSGVEARLADQGPVTQEMRALARDVQRVAEAVDETRREG